jgi:DNA topoisomerase I
MRIGNEQYARANKSFGLSTLRSRHLKRERGKLTMRYVGKHGVVHEATITNSKLKRVVAKCQELPGQMLFQYLDDEGVPQPITSADVNQYIREASGGDFTAKHFRTWGASVIAFEQLLEADERNKVSVNTMIEPVAEALGNTPAISRKSYVHPALIEAAKDSGAIGETSLPRPTKYLSAAERGLIEFLDALPEEKAKADARLRRRARAKGKSKAAAEAEIARETQRKAEAEAA